MAAAAEMDSVVDGIIDGFHRKSERGAGPGSGDGPPPAARVAVPIKEGPCAGLHGGRQVRKFAGVRLSRQCQNAERRQQKSFHDGQLLTAKTTFDRTWTSSTLI